MTKRQKLLVSGCSFTHGCETYNGFMHAKNVEQSYSKFLSDLLDTDLINVALSGASNDYIFFSIIDEILKRDPSEIHSVVVAWTTVSRLTWKSEGRYWLYTGTWATTVKPQTSGQLDFPDWDRNISKDGVWYNTDDKNNLDALLVSNKFFVDNYLLDFNELTHKLKIYSTAINDMCKQRQIKLVELLPYPIRGFDHGYRIKTPHRGHPTSEEHKNIADELFEVFYNNKIIQTV